MVTAVAITWTLITCCYKPFGRPFKVTDKGGDRSRTVVRWDMLAVFGALCLVSLGAIASALAGPSAATEATPVDKLNLIWAGISALLCGVACLVCFERPRSHREELFQTDHSGRLSFQGREESCAVHRLTTVDASLRLERASHRLSIGETVALVVDGMDLVRGHVAQQSGRTVTLSLSLPEEQRRALVVALYGRPNTNVPLQANMRRAIGGLVRRSIGRD